MSRHKQQSPLPQRRGNRFSSLLLIAGAFFIVDLIILLYFFWPGSQGEQNKAPQCKAPAITRQASSMAEGNKTKE